ncbi:hypothetical protein KIW84_063880 [Lathyrus oleraceus]|uniref:Reverse transcriptase/retrotransposon-derived protein RNase H-like domain-containing protein n=1 Tax=Pisum sativum TaxID=3888 RepID=A0A9D4WCT5_PEA|nr:hypothetical protein KIW84_063880 [Pisum sativum]
MIAKSSDEEEHVEHLLKLFQRLRKYKLLLNPNKCTFGVRSGKFFGFIVSEKGIEVDPAKVKPKTKKQVKGFLGRLNYISRLISHMTATCAPIFKLLQKEQSCDWTEDCQKAFDSIKEYLFEPLILSPHVEGRPLIMYLIVLDESMGCVLGQQDKTGRKEYVIYYLSKKFTDYETRYSMLEKTCCTLTWAAKHLLQYMLNHTTWLISKMDPIKYIFEKHALAGRIACYRSVQYDFPDDDILYLKMKDCDAPLLEEGPEPGCRWGMVFGGVVNQYGNGIGTMIITPCSGIWTHDPTAVTCSGKWTATGGTFFSGEHEDSGDNCRFSNLHHFARSLYQNKAGVMYITPVTLNHTQDSYRVRNLRWKIQANRSKSNEFRRENQLMINLGFWRFELASLLPLAKQKCNGLKDEFLEALDPNIQPDVVEF